MAGPTVAILLKEKLTEFAKEEILAFIKTISNEVRDKDFWVNGVPLGYEFGPDYPEEIDEYSGAGPLISWVPKDIISLYAMCNGEQDHVALGEVTLGIAKIVGGKVAFCHVLSHYTEDTELLNDSDLVEYEQESIIGPELFERWLKHKDFRMVK